MADLVIDWNRNCDLLLKTTEPIVRGFLAARHARGEVVVAIGYAYEFGSKQLCFDMCADTAVQSDAAPRSVSLRSSEAMASDRRWNSGDYSFPGGVQESFGDWNDEWWNELRKLDRLAESQKGMQATVHAGVAEICCQVLAHLALRGVFGDWTAMNFSVAALLDDVKIIKQRDEQIRKLIQTGSRS